jgi:choline kinase
MTLLIMAAGMGSRFGGLKQIEPIGPNGEFIIHYSIYDAIRNGFNKIVFVIKKENESLFKETIGKDILNYVEVSYAFQDLNDIPVSVNVHRIKPWGTGQAILCAKNLINENFAIINADDFYGNNCFKVLSDFLKTNKKPNNYALVGYKAINTITNNGKVKRGVCKVQNNKVLSIEESIIELDNNKLYATPLYKNNKYEIGMNTIVSMNALAFTPSIFKVLEKEFVNFLNNSKDLLNEEFLIPVILEQEISKKAAIVNLLETTSIWHGMTYREDKEEVVNAINELIINKEYPPKLWQ